MGCERLTYPNFSFFEDISLKKRYRNEKKRINYYPFGLKHANYNASKAKLSRKATNDQKIIVPTNVNSYKYKYQGQERQDEFGLNWDSFKWRNYDYAIGRFMSIDPLTEEYNTWSPYVFSGNRVVDARELEGLEPNSIHKTFNGAATNFAEQYNGLSIRANSEIGTNFYSTTNANGDIQYSYTVPTMGGEGLVDTNLADPIPEGSTPEGTAHTHSADSNGEVFGDEKTGDNFPSHQDLSSAYVNMVKTKENSKTVTVAPNGSVTVFDPATTTSARYENDVEQIDGASTTVPSDPNSNTRKNTVSPNVTPEVLPNNLEQDNYPKIDNK